MTTLFEAALLADAYDSPVQEGIPISVTFNEYESLTSDSDTSTVTKGAATPRVGQCLPPEAYREALGGAAGSVAGAGSVTEGELEASLLRLYLLTGADTTSAITWVPTLGMEVTVNAKVWRIVRIDPVDTGDEIIMYGLILEE
ncbi:MAG: hypothetical protein GY944_08620 [bacterium]|nr:hypothetical protein [bacterium]